MIFTIPNLDAGLSWWGTHWDADLHNRTYADLYALRANAFHEEWWQGIVNRLWTWKAVGRRTKPRTKAEIIANGDAPWLRHMHDIFARIFQQSQGHEPTITDLDWSDVGDLFEGACRVKPSSVFASKLCHFIFPKLFIPMDNTATGIMEYEFYWRGSQNEWIRSPSSRRQIAIAQVAERIGQRPHDSFPYEVKILELCHIGWNHP